MNRGPGSGKRPALSAQRTRRGNIGTEKYRYFTTPLYELGLFCHLLHVRVPQLTTNPWRRVQKSRIYIYNVTVTLPMLRTMTPPPPAYRKLLCPGPHTALRRHWITSAKRTSRKWHNKFLFPEKRRSSRVYLLIKWFSRLGFHTWQPSRHRGR